MTGWFARAFMLVYAWNRNQAGWIGRLDLYYLGGLEFGHAGSGLVVTYWPSLVSIIGYSAVRRIPLVVIKCLLLLVIEALHLDTCTLPQK